MLKYTFFAFILILLCNNVQGQEKKYVFECEKMGSPFAITVYSADSLTAAVAVKQALYLTDSLVAIYSDYIQDSELNKLSASAGKGINYPVSAPLLDILLKAQAASGLTAGAFDVTIGSLTQLWRMARKQKTMPPDTALHKALLASGYLKMHIDPVNSTVRLDNPGMRLDLGGIAQGYIAQKVLDLMRKEGFKKVLVNVSGDVAAGDRPAGKPGWLIGINKPDQYDELLPDMLEITNNSVTTSGDLYQFVELNGKRYSHLINPATGLGLTSRRTVTVIAKDGTTADWLTKAASILEITKAIKLAESLHAEVLIMENSNGLIKSYRSAGFNNYFKKS